jgi:THUMP domain-like/RNA cap guanine-N2 methyltransferase
MTRDRLEFLRSPEGREAAAEARRLGVAEPLRTLSALRRRWTAEEAAAAFELASLRARAAAKFRQAEAMFFEREALEQASGERIARWRARRFAGRPVVADLCCGIGGDTIALAEVAPVIAVDRDRLRLELLRENVHVCGAAHPVWPVCAHVPDVALRITAAFADPSRRMRDVRGQSRRARTLAAMSPPLEALLAVAERIPDLGIKLSPALDDEELAAVLGEQSAELEFISDGGECREAVLWLGALATAARRATVLPAGETRAVLSSGAMAGPRRPSPPAPFVAGWRAPGPGTGARRGEAPALVRSPGAYLYEPDAAIVRAHLVDVLAEELEAWTLDPQIAYLSSDRLRPTPLAAAFAVQEVMPFNLRALRRALAARGYRDVVVKKRGFPMEPEALRRELAPHLRGGTAGEAVVLVARVGDGHLAIIGERV